MELSALETASECDRDAIVAIIHSAVKHLNAAGISQWDAQYPNANNVDEDLRKGELYVARAEGTIAGIVTLNRAFDMDYHSIKWRYQGPDFAVVHRLIVPPDVQGRGIGTRMMHLAETMLRENGVKSVRLDAYAKNPYSLRLYEKLGYSIRGQAEWRMGLFYLMEKDISAEG